jgi:hypothetical protein
MKIVPIKPILSGYTLIVALIATPNSNASVTTDDSIGLRREAGAPCRRQRRLL